MEASHGYWVSRDLLRVGVLVAEYSEGELVGFRGGVGVVSVRRATKTDARRSVAGKAHDYCLRQRAKRALKYAAVRFSGVQARAVGRGLGDFVEKSGLSVRACSILPEHVHLVVGRFRYKVEQIVNLLKGEATRRLSQEGLHPFVHVPGDDGKPRSPWARRE